MERFIQTLQQECLDDFVMFREKPMNYLVSELVARYHEERTHQAEESHAFLGFIGTGENENNEGRMLDWWPLSGTMHCNRMMPSPVPARSPPVPWLPTVGLLTCSIWPVKAES